MLYPTLYSLKNLLVVLLQAISISSIEGIPPELNREALQSVTSQPLPTDPDQAYLEAGTRLSQFMADRGYLACQTDVLKQDVASLKLVAHPGNRYRLRVIQITGNRAIPSSKLRTALSLPVGDWLYRYQLDYGLENMLRLYSARGFIRSSADYKVIEDSTRNGVTLCRLYIAITENKLYHISNIIINDVPPNLVEAARRATDLHNGEPFIPEEVYAGVSRLRGFFLGHGYPFAKVQLQTSPNDESATVAIELDVITNEPYTIARHSITGNKGLTALAILPYLKPDPGDIYDDAAIRNSLRLLERQPAIATAKLEEIGPDGTLTWRVTERPATNLSGALGYEPSNESLGGGLNLASVNLFGGGERARLRWSRQSINHSSGELFYHHPRLASPTSFAESTGTYTEDTLYTKWEAELGVGTELWEALEGAVGGLGGRSWNDRGKSSKQGVYARLALAAITPLDNPHTGWEGTARGEWAVKDIHDRKGTRRLDLPKLQGELWRHFHLTGPLVLSLRAEGKSIFTPPPVPRDEWWLVGGLAGPRGYLEQELTGTEMFMGTMELRYLLGGSARVFLFGDMAQVKAAEIGTNLYPGYGVGLVAGSELGNWTIEFGLGKHDTLLTGKVHVGFSAWF